MPQPLLNNWVNPLRSSELTPPIIRLLRTLGIAEVAYALNGGGDSGETSIEHVFYRDGREEPHLPSVPIRIGPAGQISTLDGVLSDYAADKPDGDWVNNEGGYGTVEIFPFETDPDLMVECDMTYREDGDYGDGDDYDDEDLDPIDVDLTEDADSDQISVEIVIDEETRS